MQAAGVPLHKNVTFHLENDSVMYIASSSSIRAVTCIYVDIIENIGHLSITDVCHVPKFISYSHLIRE